MTGAPKNIDAKGPPECSFLGRTMGPPLLEGVPIEKKPLQPALFYSSIFSIGITDKITKDNYQSTSKLRVHPG